MVSAIEGCFATLSADYLQLRIILTRGYCSVDSTRATKPDEARVNRGVFGQKLPSSLPRHRPPPCATQVTETPGRRSRRLNSHRRSRLAFAWAVTDHGTDHPDALPRSALMRPFPAATLRPANPWPQGRCRSHSICRLALPGKFLAKNATLSAAGRRRTTLPSDYPRTRIILTRAYRDADPACATSVGRICVNRGVFGQEPPPSPSSPPPPAPDGPRSPAAPRPRPCAARRCHPGCRPL